MNLAIRGISANLGEMAANTFTNDQHKDLKADFIMANPPFNQKQWRAENELVDDPRWNGYEVPPTSNANYGWILNIVSKLSQNGVAGFLLANGALSDDGTELKIRQQLIENHLVEAIIILPRNLFYTTDISVTLWVLNKNKKARVVEQNGNACYKSYAGIYADDLVCFIGLLGYMAHFENKEQIINEKLEMQGEYFNGYVCQQLFDYYNRRRSKLPIDFIDKNDEEYFLNRRGAKVYFDITKQPVLEIAEGSQTEMVLSVGMDKSGIPLITISNDGNPICYRLPEELSDWAYTAIGMANMGDSVSLSTVLCGK